MKVMPRKCLLGLVVIALVLTFWPVPSEPEPARSPLVTMVPVTQDIVTVDLRSHAKLQIGREVAAGQRSLVEAAVLFRELNRLPPAAFDLTLLDGIPSALRAPVSSDEDRLCRQVVECVHHVLWSEVSWEAAVEAVARLESEFRAAPREHGVIRLPDPSGLTPVQELLDAARARHAQESIRHPRHSPGERSLAGRAG
jgi:hypothetical protein